MLRCRFYLNPNRFKKNSFVLLSIAYVSLSFNQFDIFNCTCNERGTHVMIRNCKLHFIKRKPGKPGLGVYVVPACYHFIPKTNVQSIFFFPDAVRVISVVLEFHCCCYYYYYYCCFFRCSI